MNKKLDALLDTLEEVKNPKETVSVIHSAFGEKSHLVAFVDVDESLSLNEKLEYAYRWTNNVGGSWSMKIGPDANDNVEEPAPPKPAK